MGANTTIAWTDHTFNPWIGCTHVHDGCRFCYAEYDFDHRYGRAKWGVNGTRVRTAVSTWKRAVRWNLQAHRDGVQHRVFCASLADVFEDRAELEPWRGDLFKLIDDTPYIDWQLLTKRPENIVAMWPGEYRAHVWLGTSVSDQHTADIWIPRLLAHRDLTPVLFISAEPLLGPVDLSEYLPRLDWVIVGGESGPNARPMQLGWARQVRDQCQAYGVPFFFKQVGGRKDKGGKSLDGAEHCDFPTTRTDPVDERA